MIADLVKKSATASVLKMDQAQGVVTALVSTFGVRDSYGERMRPGCYAASLAKKMPRVCSHHDWSAVIGRVVSASEMMPGDEELPETARPYGGLVVTMQYCLDTQAGRESYALIAGGFVDEYSVGYYELKSTQEEGEHWVDEVDLVEVSPVLRGANPITGTVAVKQQFRGSGVPFGQQVAEAQDAISNLIKRAEDVKSLRESDGGRFSPSRLAELQTLHDSLGEFITRVQCPDEPAAAAVAVAAARIALLKYGKFTKSV